MRTLSLYLEDIDEVINFSSASLFCTKAFLIQIFYNKTDCIFSLARYNESATTFFAFKFFNIFCELKYLV